MAFSIPAQAFYSFSTKQALDSLWRMTNQWHNSDWLGSDSQQNLSSFKKYIEVLKNHEVTALKDLAFRLEQMRIETQEDLEKVVMFLERKLQKDIAEDDFLITTEDTHQPKRDFDDNSVELHVVLDNLRSSFNVGSLFRSAEAFGAMKIHLCGYTATPENSKTAKSALGAQQWVSWQYWENTHSCLDELKKQGFTLCAFETIKEASTLHHCQRDLKVALILGNERYGLAAPTLKRADKLLCIPLKGRKNSLNVGVCGAIAMEHFLRGS